MSITAHFAAKAYRTAETVAWVIAGLGGIVFCYALAMAIVDGPAARARAEQAKAQEIEQENAVFCRKHAMPPGSDAYPACASDLIEIRHRQEARDVKDFDLP
jgi:hypothetical protein